MILILFLNMIFLFVDKTYNQLNDSKIKIIKTINIISITIVRVLILKNNDILQKKHCAILEDVKIVFILPVFQDF